MTSCDAPPRDTAEQRSSYKKIHSSAVRFISSALICVVLINIFYECLMSHGFHYSFGPVLVLRIDLLISMFFCVGFSVWCHVLYSGFIPQSVPLVCRCLFMLSSNT